ncbi:MAG: M2 family metallopeptidase [Rubrobacter sp.]|nr:M2 family metallopeptidase [Rubrobacter sp.]
MTVDPAEVQDFITRFETRLDPAEKAVCEAWWRLATTGTEEAQRELVRAGTGYTRLFSDREEFEKVAAFHEAREDLDSPLLARQLEVLFNMFSGNQGDRETLERVEELEARANAVYSNHRAVVGGREAGENEVRGILRTSDDDGLRREAWEASKTVGREVEGTVRELARLRNELARQNGHSDHHTRSLHLQEIEPAELDRLMQELEAATDEPFRAFMEKLDADLRERFGVEEVRPWHLSDPFFQQPPEDAGGYAVDVDRYFRDRDLEALTRRTYDSLGLDVRGVMARSDLYEREGKSQHAFCLPVGRDYPYDVRVLANLRPGAPDAYWADTMLHEFGHAVYDNNVNPKLPRLLRTVAHTNTTEAIALMMGGLAEDPGWLSSVAGVPEEELAEELEDLAGRRRATGLVFLRWTLVMYHFEKALYADPDREDLGSVWWDLVERFQLVKRPPGRDQPDWATKIHVAISPVYYHNYVLGHLIGSQLRNYLETYITRGPFYENQVAGRYLQESIFGPGARESWRETVTRATGEPLNAQHFVESLG